ncbi:DNA repair helicase [Artomyces pyxidatus]|uniref:DNA repair helicase n=1 Tax=Artomyces pyxidatus TaxID=48021 RepID=A0ACB8SPZ4_9AGAM|nr:DNA repair helicase [Artomyces pyxidatus]
MDETSIKHISLTLPTPAAFTAFPYDPPYAIQVDLMRHLYTSIEERKVAIVESPTGTGKTLSLLSASLTWLDDDRDRARKGQLDALAGGDGPDWVIAQTQDRLRRELDADEQEYEERLAKARKREEALKKMSAARVRKRMKPNPPDAGSDSDDALLPDDDSEERDVDSLFERQKSNFLSTSDANEHRPACTKIFYASRTHSQLSQVVPELKKLRRSARHISASSQKISAASQSISPKERKKRDHIAVEYGEEDIDRPQSRIVTLGSRKQLCLNEDLKARGGDLDENCRELLQAASDKRCPYLPRMGDPDDGRLHDLRDQILASPKDIEDLVSAGQLSHTCPYFASREAIAQAELVTLPYNLLLQKNAREALSIDLSNQIIVVDEAHNLLSTLLSLSTVTLPLRTLELCLAQLSAYMSRFKNRLSSKHSLHLNRLLRLLETLRSAMLDWRKQGLAEVTTVDDVLLKLGRKLEGINVLEIQSYLRRSKLAKKIATYAKSAEEKQSKKGGPRHSANTTSLATPPLYVVQEFIAALAEATDDGRIIYTESGKDGVQGIEIKYQSLNPSPSFRPVVDLARSVVLAGGTMSPMSEFVNQLFAHLPQSRLSLFSCSHIIPEANLQTLAIARGPRGTELNFKSTNMHEKSIMTELGQILLNFARIVPGGMVVFLPSYKALHQVIQLWTEAKLMDGLNTKKKVFIEPTSTTDVNSILQQYTLEIQNSKSGALLLAVVGAKLSEGLNFSDDLARMVVVAGLPYANMGSAELQERMKYADRALGQTPQNSQYGPAGRELYENMCMNAVNQSIGRAIRHKNDWATLVLIDTRYQSEKIRKKLPQWIGRTLVTTQTFGQAIKSTSQFLSAKKNA